VPSYLYETLLGRLSIILGSAWVGLTYSWEWCGTHMACPLPPPPPTPNQALTVAASLRPTAYTRTFHPRTVRILCLVIVKIRRILAASVSLQKPPTASSSLEKPPAASAKPRIIMWQMDKGALGLAGDFLQGIFIFW
jgi:hypothetical protein